MPDMSDTAFVCVIDYLKGFGVSRIELFANDPILHPEILQQVKILNDSGLEFAILTIGDNPDNPTVKDTFWKVAGCIDKDRGGFVFSVDLTEEDAKHIMNDASYKGDKSYAFKAQTFWEMAPELQRLGIKARINVVITRNNVTSVSEIMERAAQMGFAASCCFVQYQQPTFREIVKNGHLSDENLTAFREFIRASELLDEGEVSAVVERAKKIVSSGNFSAFNAFRGNDPREGDIPETTLSAMRDQLIALKSRYPEHILPSEDFVNGLGNAGFGCLELLKQGKFPQMKIGPEGQIWFCCDLHDPETARFHLHGIVSNSDAPNLLLRTIRTNPYIWLCAWANPCDFSVNHVQYQTKTKK